MAVRVAISGCSTEEDFDRRVIFRLFSFAASLGYDYVNPSKFKDLMKEYTESSNPSGHDVLVAFNDLSEDVKESVLKKCCGATEEMTLAHAGKSLLDTIPPVSYSLSEADIRRELKYCKNPMQRKNLQREFNSSNFMQGKHRRGKQRR